MTARLDALIDDLGADLRAVHRLDPPLRRAAAWLALVAATGLALAAVADLPGLARRLADGPDLLLAVMGSATTAVLAAVAAFQLSLPDRHPAAWVLLPAPALGLWIVAAGAGCGRDWVVPHTHPATLHEARTCFAFIVGLSVPLSAAMVLMIRRACPIRPGLASAAGGLATAAAAATLLTLVHPTDASAADLAVHAGAVALVVGLNRALGGRLLDAGPRAPGRR